MTRAPRTTAAIIIGWTITALLLLSALLLAFAPSLVRPKIAGVDKETLRTIGFLSKLWFLSTPLGILIGIISAHLVSLTPPIVSSAIKLLRVAQWAPFLTVYTLAFALTVGWEKMSWEWVIMYCGSAVAFGSAYEYLVAGFNREIGRKSAIKETLPYAIKHGLFICVLLTILLFGEAFLPWRTREVGIYLFAVLAIVVLTVNWVASKNFDSAAVRQADALLRTVKTEQLISFPWLFLWFSFLLIVGPVLLSVPPEEVFAAIANMVKTKEFYRDIFTSAAELGIGLVISGAVAGVITIARNRSQTTARLTNLVLQICQVAPIALLPNLQYAFGISLATWSTACVVVFTFHPLLAALTGLASLKIVPRVVLATNEALPYGCAAFVFGEMWNAQAGIGFTMTVAAATLNLSGGLAMYLVLLFLFTVITMVLRYTTNNMLEKDKTV